MKVKHDIQKFKKELFRKKKRKYLHKFSGK